MTLHGDAGPLVLGSGILLMISVVAFVVVCIAGERLPRVGEGEVLKVVLKTGACMVLAGLLLGAATIVENWQYDVATHRRDVAAGYGSGAAPGLLPLPDDGTGWLLFAAWSVLVLAMAGYVLVALLGKQLFRVREDRHQAAMLGALLALGCAALLVVVASKVDTWL